MKYVLSRDDLMLKNSEYNALERASGIIGRLATYWTEKASWRLSQKQSFSVEVGQMARFALSC